MESRIFLFEERFDFLKFQVGRVAQNSCFIVNRYDIIILWLCAIFEMNFISFLEEYRLCGLQMVGRIMR